MREQRVVKCALASPKFVEMVEEVLARHAVRPCELELEITERALLGTPAARKAATDLHPVGVRLALDDFGTGYSSLEYLSELPIDVLKIDRSFIQALTRGQRHFTIVNTIMQLARGLGLEVVAEGVEDADQRDALIHLGCRCAQGFFFHRPASAETLTHQLAIRRRLNPMEPVPR